MRSSIGLIAWLILATVIDTALIWPLPSIAGALSFGMATMVIAALALSTTKALIWSVGQGVMLDFFSPTIFGTYALTAIIIVLVVAALRETWFKQTSMLTISLITIFSLSSAYVLQVILHWSAEWFGFIIVNPMMVLTLGGIIIALIIECIIVNVTVRVLSVFNKLVLL